MDIRTYIFNQRTTAAAMAKDLQVSPNYLREVAKGNVKPSIRLATEIESYTGGQVKAVELMDGWTAKQPTKPVSVRNSECCDTCQCTKHQQMRIETDAMIEYYLAEIVRSIKEQITSLEESFDNKASAM